MKSLTNESWGSNTDTREHLPKAKKGWYPLSGKKYGTDSVTRAGRAELMCYHSYYKFTENVPVQTRQYSKFKLNQLTHKN
jgi:hypothetical protein